MIEFKNYELNEKLTIGPYIFELRLSAGSKKYFLIGLGWDVEEIFRDLKVDKYSYIQSIVGYESKGAFPETKTLEDLNKIISQLQIDYLIKEAKERYPVGTKYIPTHISNDVGNFIVKNDQEIVFVSNTVCLKNPNGSFFDNNRNNHYANQVLWMNNKWAEIITEEPKQPEINTYGLSVGDVLDKDIIGAWTNAGKNYFYLKDWRKTESNFFRNREILSFKEINGVLGFLVSDTDVHLRAEGFKEFAESFDKPKFEVGKWYKSNVTSNNCNKFYYLKVLGVEKECPHGQAINIFNGKNYVYNKEHKWTFQKTIEQALSIGPLTDLSEIQQYLPDGHPDKIKAQPEYIVGKWYKMGTWIAKFKELDGDKFRVFKSGTPFDNYKYSDSGYLLIDRQKPPILITDMTEVYKLFPEEKPNDDDFEVNDWVVVERLPRYNNLSLPQTSTIFQVNKSRATPYAITLTDKDGGIFYFRKEELRFATLEEVDKEIERRRIMKDESSKTTQINKSVVIENKPITLKPNQADPIVLEEQQVPELAITIKTNKTNKLFINPIKTITL